MLEFKPCNNNGCIDGYIYLESGEVAVCDCRKKWKDTVILQDKLVKANLPISITSYDLSQYKGTKSINNIHNIQKYIDHFNKLSNKHFYFYGTTGTQKSHLVRYIGKELLRKNISVYYLHLETLLSILMKSNSFNKEDREAEVNREFLLNQDLLIIDEFQNKRKKGANVSGYSSELLQPFLKERVEVKEKSIILVSNTPRDELGSTFHFSIQALVSREFYQLEFKDIYESEVNKFDITDGDILDLIAEDDFQENNTIDLDLK